MTQPIDVVTPSGPGASHEAATPEWLEKRLDDYRSTHPPRAVPTPAGAFRYTIGGQGSGARVIVVLHGGGSIAEAAHPFCIALEADARVVAIDWPDSAASVDDVVAGINAVLSDAGVGDGPVSFLGFSMGGMLAQVYAAACSARVEGLVLYVSMGPSPRYAKRFKRYGRVMSLIPATLLRAASRKAVVTWATKASAQDPAAAAFIAAQRRAMFDDGLVTKRSLLSDSRLLVDFFRRTDLRVTCPMLIVEADNDRMVDAPERAAVKARYPQAEVITLAATDHFAGVLAPPPIMAAITSFFRRH